MVSIAKNKKHLRSRMLNFFNENSATRKDLVCFVNLLSETSHIFVFGGLIRDIALKGVSEFNSDVDLVFDGNPDQVESILLAAGAKRNKFGGFRLKKGGWFIDIWEASSTWAFRQGSCEYSGISSLLQTTITNWDSILFDLRNKELLYTDNYFKDLEEGYLDVNLLTTPNELGMYIRILRCYLLKGAHRVSANAALQLKAAVEKYSYEELKNYESSSYKDSYISESIYDYLKNHKEISDPNLFPVQLEEYNQTISLIS